MMISAMRRRELMRIQRELRRAHDRARLQLTFLKQKRPRKRARQPRRPSEG